jgi:hypothetical protein
MKTVEVAVTQVVKVTVDETKFTEEFLAEFRAHFYPFNTLKDHIEHLGQMHIRGVIGSDFIEGYGPPEDMGIKFEDVRYIEVESDDDIS